MSEATSSLEQLATDLPEKLRFLMEEAGAAQEEMNGFEESLSSMQEEVGGLVEQIETSLDELQTEITEHQTELTESIADLGSEFESLQSEVASDRFINAYLGPAYRHKSNRNLIQFVLHCIYKLGQGVLTLTVRNAEIAVPEAESFSVMKISANIHHELSQFSKQERLIVLSQLVKKFAE